MRRNERTPPAERSSNGELECSEAKPPEVETEVRYSYSFEANEEFQAVLKQAQAITGVSGVADVIQKALRLLVETRRPKAGKTRKLKPKAEGGDAVSAAVTAPTPVTTTSTAATITTATAPTSASAMTTITTTTAGAATTDSPPLLVASPKSKKTEKLYGPLSQSVRRQVFERDCECCTYVSEDGVRCGEQRYLQVDHILPVARGGSNELENLRLLCRSHNLLLAEQWMGREFIERKRNERRGSSTSAPA